MSAEALSGCISNHAKQAIVEFLKSLGLDEKKCYDPQPLDKTALEDFNIFGMQACKSNFLQGSLEASAAWECSLHETVIRDKVKDDGEICEWRMLFFAINGHHLAVQAHIYTTHYLTELTHKCFDAELCESDLLALDPDDWNSHGWHYFDFDSSNRNCDSRLKPTSIPKTVELFSTRGISDQQLKRLASSFAMPTYVTTVKLESIYGLKDLSSIACFIHVSTLEVSNCPYLSDISALSSLLNISALSLTGCPELSDISPVSRHYTLSSLDLSMCQNISGLSLLHLSGLLRLKSLDLGGCSRLDDLSGLVHLTNLISLDISHCKSLRNIAKLSCLQSLKNIDISHTRFTDLTPIASLQNLATLEMRGCEGTTDLSPLRNLANLTDLTMSACRKVQDLSPLSNLSRLTSLNLRGFRIPTIDFIGQLSRLTTLTLDNWPCLEDITPIGNLRNLKTLNISRCRTLKDITAVANLNNLTCLSLDFCQSLEDLSPLKCLSQIESLSIHNTSASSISPLRDLRTLRALRILDSDCSISTISPIEHLNQLEHLQLSCQMATWSEEEFWITIQSLTNLKSLVIENAPLHHLGNFESQTLLQPISIKGISALNNLTYLAIKNCATLKSLSALANLTRLEYLDVSGCESLRSIQPLMNCRALQSIRFTSRWVTSISHLRLLPSLSDIGEFSQLDCIDVLANSAFLRRDRQKIFSSFEKWYEAALPITALERSEKGEFDFERPLEFREKLSMSLASALSICGPTPFEGYLEGFLAGNPDLSPAPWKAWYAGILTHGGFAMYKRRVEIVSVEKIQPSAVGAICATLPCVVEAEWSRAWLKRLALVRTKDSKTLLPVAAEICLACARLGESQLLQSWLESFTNPSDSEALDRVHSAFAEMHISDNKITSAEDHISKIHNSRLADVTQSRLISHLLHSNTNAASRKLLLIHSKEIREALIPLFLSKTDIVDETINNLLVAAGFDNTIISSIINGLTLTYSNSPEVHRFRSSDSQLLQTLSERIRNSRPETLRRAASKLRALADEIEQTTCNPISLSVTL